LRFSFDICRMEIVKAQYLISNPKVEGCPEPDRPEYAFIGRSNVGKSSLINMICNNQKLAKTSGSPGKTQLINHFDVASVAKAGASAKEVADRWYLVDLPGYGYAKVAQSQRKSWSQMISHYIRRRNNLCNLFVLIDSRHSPQAIDIEFINQLGEWKTPFCIVFTKTDKITQKEVSANVKAFMQALSKQWQELPGYFLTSAIKKRGTREILEAISLLNGKWKSEKS
jgi:GTP-binding protein